MSTTVEERARQAGFVSGTEYLAACQQACDWFNRGVPLAEVIAATRLPEAIARMCQDIVANNPKPERRLRGLQ